MNEIKESTEQFLDLLPEINSANTYGSGYFNQGKNHEIQALDLILSVDNPNLWHTLNYEANPWMYKGSGMRGLLNYSEDASFPKGLGAFFTTYKGRDYKLVVIDKRLLYDNLKTWNHFSLSGRFQKPTTLIIDNSNGVLPSLMKENYDGAIKTAMLLCPRTKFKIDDLYEKIALLSYLGDIRRIFHFEDPNKTRNIVEGAFDFFEEVYGNSDIFKRFENNYILRNDISNLEIVEELPENLKNHIHDELSYKGIRSDKKLAKTVEKYFRDLDFMDSIQMALRCNQTVGMQKTMETLAGKAKKGMQKVRK